MFWCHVNEHILSQVSVTVTGCQLSPIWCDFHALTCYSSTHATHKITDVLKKITRILTQFKKKIIIYHFDHCLFFVAESYNNYTLCVLLKFDKDFF